jgi:alpha-tubulin suppressor-like RCC1 family protein
MTESPNACHWSLLALVLIGCAKSHGPSVSTETGNPPLLDSGKVALVVVSDDVYVRGQPGAVTPARGTVEVEVLRTHSVASGAVRTNGSFEVRVDAVLDDRFVVHVVDGELRSAGVLVDQGGARNIGGGSGGKMDAGAAILASDGAADYGFDFTQIAVGGRHACGLVSDGSMLCWGLATDERIPTSDVGAGWKQIAAGGYHTCALRTSGSLQCWGAGALEVGQVSGPNADGGADFAQVSAGNRHTCAVRNDGSLVCWGYNNAGQVSGPNAAAVGSFAQVTAGYEHTCALDVEGHMQCWGDDRYGQVSGPNSISTADFAQITAGAGHTCALRKNGRLTCWGTGEWADEVSGPNADDRTDYIQVMAAAYQTCGVHAGEMFTGTPVPGSTVTCWGDDSDGQVSGPNRVGITGFTQLAGSIEVDGNFVCGLLKDGTVECWGADDHGQISDLDELARQPR